MHGHAYAGRDFRLRELTIKTDRHWILRYAQNDERESGMTNNKVVPFWGGLLQDFTGSFATLRMTRVKRQDDEYVWRCRIKCGMTI